MKNPHSTAEPPSARPAAPVAYGLVQLGCFHLAGGEEPQGKELRFQFPTGDGELYQRRLTIRADQGWVLLDLGWNQESEYIFLHHVPPQRISNPTAEEREQDKGRLLGIRFEPGENPHLVLKAGEAVPFRPWHTKNVYLQCSQGELKLVILVFPR